VDSQGQGQSIERRYMKYGLQNEFDKIHGCVIVVKPYPSASGGTKCCSREGGFVLERIANTAALGCPDDRLSPLLD
jgi:hypothetical protein